MATLSEKDQELFKKAERLFQKKQNKQALKAIELVLKKNEKHGESVALKGAILGRLATTDEEKAEALDVCKRGVAFDISSKNSWAHLARLHQANMNYAEAVKAFKKAIQFCKPAHVVEKMDYRRNTMIMLAQLRLWSELADLRRQVQLEHPDQPLHWVGYSVALMHAKKYDLALSVFREFRKNAPASFTEKENAEVDMFEVRILEESGDFKGALDLLKSREKFPNVLFKEETCARCELLLGEFDAARERFLNLIKTRNPENYDYHRGLQAAELKDAKLFTRGGLSLPVNASSPTEVIGRVINIYDDLAKSLPKSLAIQRIPLDFCGEAAFKEKSDTFIRNYLRKCVPCLFALVKTLYKTRPELAAKVFGDIIQKRLQELASESDAKEELAYTLFFKSQHYDKTDPGCDNALTTIDEALKVEPNNADFLRFKARILKHAGDFPRAFEVADSARLLEPSDRYLNNKASKYALRAERPEVALALTHLFTRGEDVNSLPDPAVLHDIQCMWFELESGESAARTGDVITALKQFYWVEKHINQVRDDEFDFHEYCLRRFVLTSYANFIRMEDSIRSVPAFRRAVKGAVQCWLRVYDNDEGTAALKQHEKAEAQARKAAEKDNDESQFAGMTPAERKRAMKKIKQEKEAREKAELARKLEETKKLTSGVAASAPATQNDEEEENAAEEPAQSEDKQADLANMSRPRRRRDIAPDDDPKGFKRFAKLHKESLKAASQLLDLALPANPNDAELLLLNFDVNVRKNDLSAAWKSLSKAVELTSADAPEVLERLIPFARFSALGATPSTSSWGKTSGGKFVLDEATRKELDSLLSGVGKPIVEVALANLSSSDSRLALSSAVGLLAADVDVDKAVAAIQKVVAPLKIAIRAQQVLKSRDPKAAEDHKNAAKARWPRAVAFA